MILQLLQLVIGAVTVPTFVGLVLVMPPPMLLQVGELTEGLITACIKTLVWLHAGVDASVLLQMRQLLERLVTEGAVIGLVVGVHS